MHYIMKKFFFNWQWCRGSYFFDRLQFQLSADDERRVVDIFDFELNLAFADGKSTFLFVTNAVDIHVGERGTESKNEKKKWRSCYDEILVDKQRDAMWLRTTWFRDIKNPTSLGVSERASERVSAAERASEVSSTERTNTRMDKRVA